MNFIKKIFLSTSVFFLAGISLLYCQVPNLIITPSVDGCIYINNTDKKILILDKVYADIELEEDEIIFNEQNTVKYNDVFGINKSKKYQYFLVEIIRADSQGIYNTSERVSIKKKSPILNHKWELIDFDFASYYKKEYTENCSTKIDISNYNELLYLEGNNQLIIDISNNDSKSSFKVISEEQCRTLYYESFDKDDVKLHLFNKNLCFMHSGQLLYIIKIVD